jgi:hypothetical protein
MHGGVHSRLEKHGRETLKAKTQRKQERSFLREMSEFNKEINAILEDNNASRKKAICYS